jgi:hypothetical protein
MTGDEGAAVKMTAWRSAMLVVATLVIALIGTSAALADQPKIVDCTLRFQLSGWSALYERVDGTGIVACADGTSLTVFVQAHGAGLTSGRPKVTAGTGKFADVREISDVLGTYGQGDVYVGVVQSGEAGLLSNGKVSLGLAGQGDGYDFRSGVVGFAIRPQ